MITHEEVFREPREFCKDKSQHCKRLYQRKFFYLFTCEYCTSHYVTALFLLLTHFQMLFGGWRGFVISEFALVWIANVYMSAYNRLRLEIKAENLSSTSKPRRSIRLVLLVPQRAGPRATSVGVLPRRVLHSM